MPEERIPEVLKIIKLTGDLELLSEKESQEKVRELKEQLNSDNPILALSSRNGFSFEEVFEKSNVYLWWLENPDSFLKPTDLIWRKMEGLPGCYHVAIYLGNKRVAHIGSSKFMKASKIKDNKKLLGARIDH